MSETARTMFGAQPLGPSKAALKLAREKFQFDATKVCHERLPKIKATPSGNCLTDIEKIDRIHEKVFGPLATEAAA